MKTYYLSFHCKPHPAHSNTARFIGMEADLFIAAESEDEVEPRVQRFLKDAGWTPDELEFAEEVQEPAAHDTRFSELFRKSQKNGIAAIFSPF